MVRRDERVGIARVESKTGTTPELLSTNLKWGQDLGDDHLAHRRGTRPPRQCVFGPLRPDENDYRPESLRARGPPRHYGLGDPLQEAGHRSRSNDRPPAGVAWRARRPVQHRIGWRFALLSGSRSPPAPPRLPVA